MKKQLLINLALACLLCAFGQEAALADVTVTGAQPGSALQGTVDLDVEITGTDFDASAQVSFLISGTSSPGGVHVKKVKVRGSKKLIATIDVDADALAGDFDIEVLVVGGRRGKGTALFAVQQNNGNAREQKSCEEIYYGAAAGDPPNYCTDLSGGHCMFSRPGDNTPGWIMLGDCRITKTLVVPPSDPFLFGDGHTMFLSNGAGAFEGTAGFTNAEHAVRVADMTIVLEAGVGDGCVDGFTAVRLDPDYTANGSSGASGGPRPAVAYVNIQTQGGSRFCNALEYAGSNPYIRIPYFAGMMHDNTIAPDSYWRYGMYFARLNTTDNVTGDYDNAGTGALEGRNTVYWSSGAAAAIMFEDVERAIMIGGNEVWASGAGAVGVHFLRTGINQNPGPAACGAGYDCRYLEARSTQLEGATIHISAGATGVLIEDSDVGAGREGSNRKNTFIGDGTGTSYQLIGSPTPEFPIKGKQTNLCATNADPVISGVGEGC